MNDTRWADKHVTLVGVFHIVYHAIAFAIGLVVATVFGALGAITGDPQADAILSSIGAVIGAALILIALPGILGGIGLLARKPWGRIVALIVGGIDLLDIPLGTALGIYTFWVLMNDDVVNYLGTRGETQ
jgi:hypothetical protein